MHLTLANDPEKQCLYRYDAVRVSNGCDEFDESLGHHIEVYLSRYEIVKHTPKGFWIYPLSGKRFVLKDACKKFACTDEASAAESFIARKKKQIKILNAQIADAQEAITAINHKIERENLCLPAPLTSR